MYPKKNYPSVKTPVNIRSNFLSPPSRNESLLPKDICQGMENYFGVSFNKVKLIIGTEADNLGVSAFNINENIYLSKESFESDESRMWKLICHELTHIVQQRLRPSTHKIQSPNLFYDIFLENQADRLADEFDSNKRQSEWSAEELNKIKKSASWNIIQCQTRGLINAPYLDGGINPAVPLAPLGVAFSAVNSINEVHGNRGLAFARAKTLLNGVRNARRTYHWLFGVAAIANGEGLDVDGGILGGANANQRAGRYYDFGRGRLIVEHIYDPNSTTAIGGGGHLQRGHFHVASYNRNTTHGKYMEVAPAFGAAHPPVAGGLGPTVYDFDRRYGYEMFGGIQGHHIYYH